MKNNVNVNKDLSNLFNCYEMQLSRSKFGFRNHHKEFLLHIKNESIRLPSFCGDKVVKTNL